MSWRPPHEGEGRYRHPWLARAFNVAMVCFALGAVGCVVWLVLK